MALSGHQQLEVDLPKSQPGSKMVRVAESGHYIPAFSSVEYTIPGDSPQVIRSKVYQSDSCTSPGGSPVDAVEVEMTDLCRMHPEIAEKNSIMRISAGRYLINGRELSIHVVTVEKDAGSSTEIVGADLVVHDGPLTQPFLDYMFNTGLNEHYDLPDGEVAHRVNPLFQLAQRLELNYDKGMPYAPFDRIAAMNLARYEAWLRDSDARQRLESSSAAPLHAVGVEVGRDSRSGPSCTAFNCRLFSEVLPPDIEALPPFTSEATKS